MTDPGLALKRSTLPAAWRLLGAGGAARMVSDPIISVEELARAGGLRVRRVKLDGAWWKQAAEPMLARVADRRRAPRGDDEDVEAPGGTGWVALVPRAMGGFTMRAAHPDGAGVIECVVDVAVAARLSPFAHAFHARFPARALGARDVMRFAFAQGGRDLGLLLLAGLAAALVGLLTPVATGWLIDRAIPAGAAAGVGLVIGALAVAGIALVALDALRAFAVMRFEARVGGAVQAALIDRVIAAPARFFRGYSSGDLALRMGSVNSVQRAITGSTLATFVTSIFLLANLALMLAYSPPLTLAASGILLLVVAISTTLGLLRLRVGPRIEALDGQLGAMTYELFAGIAKLRAAAAEGRMLERWYARYDAYRHANGDSARLSNLEAVALSLLQPAATLLVLALAWKLAAGGAALTPGQFVAFHAALFALLGGVHALVSTALEVVNLRPLWERARPILETVPEDGAAGHVRHDPQGAVSLHGVAFAYPGGPPVLQDIDLEIRPGEFVAIVGASGSGKSTLMRLLLGFEAPDRGTVRYDGRDLATLDVKHLRGRLGTVLQGGRLWAGDLLANIVGAAALGPEEAMEAARAAGLAADIEAMPMGLYTVVGEGLSTLSGGQRQRVLLARALVGAPKVLLLDEATSALDNVSQARVLEALAKLEATRVVIAHRLNTVRDADRILVLEAGRIVQQGTYRQLAGQRGAFSAMLARQVA